VTFTPDAVRAIWRGSGGLPRVVNLLCDRALEAAYHRQLRTIDADLVETAAAERLPQGPPRVPDIWMPPQVDAGRESIAAPVENVSTTTRRSTLVPVSIGVLAVTVVAAWFGYRALKTDTDSRPTPSGVQPSAAAPAIQPPQAASPIEPAAASAPASPRPDAATPEPAAAAARGAAAPSNTAPSFEIVVASFRTESRADAVAAQVWAPDSRSGGGSSAGGSR
jgi:general secretion pathway protein A